MSLALVDALPLISVHVTLTVLLWMPKDVYHASVKVPKIQIHQAPVIQENTSSTTLCFFSATTVAPSGQSTSATVTSVPGAGGCPAFDFSTCDPSCVVMDGQGCMSCHCKGTFKTCQMSLLGLRFTDLSLTVFLSRTCSLHSFASWRTNLYNWCRDQCSRSWRMPFL